MNDKDTLAKIKEQVASYPILLYMKGTPQFPQCGFSARAVSALAACGCRFSFVNILENPDIRASLPEYANWPTFPQLFVQGELIGGSDIIAELHQSGELAKILATAAEQASGE